MSEKSQATRTSKNPFEKSCSQQAYFVRVVQDRRTGQHDFPLDKDGTWEPTTNLPGSEHMIAEFNKRRLQTSTKSKRQRHFNQ